MAHILVIDDDPVVRLMIDELLTPLGHRVVEAEEGGQGLAYLKGRDVDLVILDLFMPGVDGFEVLRTMKAADPDQRVLVISVHADEPVGKANFLDFATQLGADGTLAKPFDAALLISTVERCLKGGC
jgi:CheY-like chemotaxis protein